MPVTVFGDRYDFLVDSGSVHSLISQSIADAHQLPLLQTVGWASPSGERTQSPRVRLPLRIGGPDGIEMISNALVVAMPVTFGVKGFIGADVLRQFDVTMEEAMVRLAQRVKF